MTWLRSMGTCILKSKSNMEIGYGKTDQISESYFSYTYKVNCYVTKLLQQELPVPLYLLWHRIDIIECYWN